MDFIKIAICDDEKNIRAYLASLVRKQGRECEIAEYVSADEYLLDQTEHDLLFLDIELAGDGSGMDGMELARRIRGMELEHQPVIIFVTGYEKYVYDAEVFGRAAAQIIFEAEQKKKTLVIQYGSESRAVPIQDIYYVESRNHKVVLYLKDGELEYYEKIGRLEEELQGQFFRIHRGYLVNLAYVEGYDKTEVTLTGGISLPLSKRYEDFAAAYLQFVQ